MAGTVIAVEGRTRHEQLNVTIANGAALTDSLLLAGGHLLGIFMSAGWDAAGLTCLAGYGPTDFQDFHDSAGAEVTLTVAAGQYCAIGPTHALYRHPFRFLKLRSGTSGTPVNQTSGRSLILLIGR